MWQLGILGTYVVYEWVEWVEDFFCRKKPQEYTCINPFGILLIVTYGYANMAHFV